jgi:hypothetical protein
LGLCDDRCGFPADSLGCSAGLEPVLKVNGTLGMGGCLENRPLILLENR